jgi:hypothetical protein
MENEKEIADREQVLDQAFAAATYGNMDQAQALIGQVFSDMMTSRYDLLKRMGLFADNDITNKD